MYQFYNDLSFFLFLNCLFAVQMFWFSILRISYGILDLIGTSGNAGHFKVHFKIILEHQLWKTRIIPQKQFSTKSI